MEKKIRTDQSGDGSRLPYGWNKGDTCVMITNKAKKSTSEYMYITVKMYPCSGGTDTGSPEL